MRLTENLAEIGHVGELSRLLSTFHGHRERTIGQRELIELSNRTAGAGHRYPNPLPALALALALGLAYRSKRIVRLTGIGNQFVRTASQNLLSLTPSQSRMIFGILLDDSDFRECISSIINHLRANGSGRLSLRQTSLPDDQGILQCAKILQQLRVLEYELGYLYLNQEFEPLLPTQLLQATGLDEETLWDKLNSQRERARAVEEFVLESERERLTNLGRPDLAELVFRTSAVNVSAGFDIESFEVDGSRRYIEVKSSIGTSIQFEWSVDERETAKELSDRYWIYFVPMAHLLPMLDRILLVHNPLSHVVSGSLTEAPSAFLIQESERVRYEPWEPVAEDAVRLVQWRPRHSS